METLIISALFVYGVTTLLVDTEGPFGIFYKLRKINWLEALRCFFCLSVYIAALASLATAKSIPEWIVHTFVLSGAAIFMRKLGEE